MTREEIWSFCITLCNHFQLLVCIFILHLSTRNIASMEYDAAPPKPPWVPRGLPKPLIRIPWGRLYLGYHLFPETLLQFCRQTEFFVGCTAPLFKGSSFGVGWAGQFFSVFGREPWLLKSWPPSRLPLKGDRGGGYETKKFGFLGLIPYPFPLTFT